MKNLLWLLSLIAGLGLSTASPLAAEEVHSIAANVSFASQYTYRGIAQTRGKPALQGGFDYTHASGFYLSAWASNISWITDAMPEASASLEVDVYAGYGGNLSDQLSYDVGVLSYNYPGDTKSTGDSKPETIELYAALSYRWLTLKHSVTTSSLFGWVDEAGGATRGSGYTELNTEYGLSDGLMLSFHIGHQHVRGYSAAAYTDHSIGLAKDIGFGELGLVYSNTNAKDDCQTGQAYCFVKSANLRDTYRAGKRAFILSFSRSF